MSKTQKILQSVLKIVSIETDITESEIMSKCSKSEIVDARWICVKLLKEYGYYPSKIADLMQVTPRYVQYILTDFEDRILIGNLMRINYENSRKRMRSSLETSA